MYRHTLAFIVYMLLDTSMCLLGPEISQVTGNEHVRSSHL